MNHDQTTGTLAMQWVAETDATGRTRLVAHWMVEGQPASAAAIQVTHAA